MKKVLKLILPLLLIAGCGGGVWFYLNSAPKGETTEAAANAVASAASAYANWAKDKTAHTIEVTSIILTSGAGGRQEKVAVRAVLHVTGSSDLNKICRSMPKIRDAMTMILTGHVTPNLDGGAELAAYDERLRDQINGVLKTKMVTALRLSKGRGPLDSQKGCI